MKTRDSFKNGGRLVFKTGPRLGPARQRRRGSSSKQPTGQPRASTFQHTNPPPQSSSPVHSHFGSRSAPPRDSIRPRLGARPPPTPRPSPRRPPCRIRRKLKTIPSRWQFGQMGRAEGSSGSPRRGCIRTRTARGGAMLAVVRRCANRILYAEITDEEFGIGATGTASSMDLVSS